MKLISRFLVLITAVMLVNCQKGANDPQFSFSTRKQRLTGDWELTSLTIQGKDKLEKIENGYYVRYENEIFKDSVPVVYSISFDNAGNYSLVQKLDYPSNYFNQGNEAYSVETTYGGTWNFAGGDENYKSKSRLLLIPNKQEEVNSAIGVNVSIFVIDGNNSGQIWDMDKLSKDELWLQYNVTYSDPVSSENTTAILKFNKK